MQDALTFSHLALLLGIHNVPTRDIGVEMSTDTLKDYVSSIARSLSNGFDGELNADGEQLNAFNYLQDALDIEYIVNSKGECLGGRILVAFGGPNIWIDTRRGVVDGYWWGEQAHVAFDDGLGLEDALEELWACR